MDELVEAGPRQKLELSFSLEAVIKVGKAKEEEQEVLSRTRNRI
jgi:hypothetical protein